MFRKSRRHLGHRASAPIVALGILLLSASAWAASGTPGKAVPTGTVGISIDTPVVAISPGHSFEGKGQILNGTKTTEAIQLYPGISQQLSNGGYRLEGGAQASKWIRFSIYKVKAGPLQIVPFTYVITVPAKEPTGAYVYGAIAQYHSGTNRHKTGNVSIQVNINTLETAYLVVRVPGTLTYGVRLKGWTLAKASGHVSLQTILNNTGNAYEYIDTRLVVHNGAKKYLTPVQSLLVLAHSQAEATYEVPAVDVGPKTVGVVTARVPKKVVTASGHLMPRTPAAKPSSSRPGKPRKKVSSKGHGH